MAAEHINLPPHLVPWQGHGLDYILSKTKLAPELSLCSAQVPAKPKQNTTIAGHNAQPNRSQTYYQEQRENKPHPTPISKAQSTVSSVTTVQDTVAQIPFLEAKHWPTSWQEQLQKTPPASVVWTYFSLGDDLSGRPNDERRNFMRKLLTDLGHPRGTHSFWPVALPEHNTEQCIANAQVFWSGVELLKARAVVAMGQAATKAIGLAPNLRPFMQTRHNGCFVVVLRDVDFLITEPHLYANVREFLRRSLTPFARK